MINALVPIVKKLICTKWNVKDECHTLARWKILFFLLFKNKFTLSNQIIAKKGWCLVERDSLDRRLYPARMVTSELQGQIWKKPPRWVGPRRSRVWRFSDQIGGWAKSQQKETSLRSREIASAWLPPPTFPSPATRPPPRPSNQHHHRREGRAGTGREEQDVVGVQRRWDGPLLRLPRRRRRPRLLMCVPPSPPSPYHPSDQAIPYRKLRFLLGNFSFFPPPIARSIAGTPWFGSIWPSSTLRSARSRLPRRWIHKSLR
jgi:hypothetical protein